METLADLFELAFERLGDVQQALAVVMAGAKDGADQALAAELSRRGTPRSRCAWCVGGTQRHDPADELARRRPQKQHHVVVRDVAAHHNLTIAELRGPRRDDAVCVARFEAYWLLRQRNYSLPAIARALGRSDHCCVSNGLRRFERMMVADPELAARMRGQVPAAREAVACG